MPARLLRWARLPALHFAVVGALLFAVRQAPAPVPHAAARAPIVITADRMAEIRDDYRRTVQVEPTAAEVAALAEREAEEQMLYQEALLLGLDRNDRTVEWRVVEKMRFLFGAGAGSDAEAYRRGLELGLADEDVMVRNTLVTKMRLLAKAASRHEEPGGLELDRALEDYFRAHRDAYAQPERVSLTHVFLSAARRGEALGRDAEALRQRLRALSPEAAARLGDAFVAGDTVRGASRSALARTFGEAFADAALAAPPGRWSEPIRSPYGLHLVWVSDRQLVDVPELDAVRSRVLRAYRAERHEQYLARMMSELRRVYEVRMEDGNARG